MTCKNEEEGEVHTAREDGKKDDGGECSEERG